MDLGLGTSLFAVSCGVGWWVGAVVAEAMLPSRPWLFAAGLLKSALFTILPDDSTTDLSVAAL